MAGVQQSEQTKEVMRTQIGRFFYKFGDKLTLHRVDFLESNEVQNGLGLDYVEGNPYPGRHRTQLSLSL